MTEWRDPEPPVPSPEPEPAPGTRWAPESEQAVGEKQDDAADPRHVAADAQSDAEPGEPVTTDAVPAAPDQPSEPAPVDEPVATTAPEPGATPEPEPAAPPAPEPAESFASSAPEPAETPATPEPEPVASPAPEPVQPASPAPEAAQPAAGPASEPSQPFAGQPLEATQPQAPVPTEGQPGYTPVPPPPTPGFVAPAPPPPAAEVTAPTAGLATGWAAQAAAPGDERAVSQPTPPSSGIFRDDSAFAEPEAEDPYSEEAQKLAAERAARREAREAALTATAPAVAAPPAPVVIHKRTNDRFFGSLGLFLLRVVVAVIFVVRGLNILANIEAAQAQFATTIIPYPQIMAIVTGVACLLIALALLLGLLTRVAGLGVALIAGGVLAFVLWGPWPVFVSGQSGFIGEYELLLAAVGLLFLFVGGGGWSVDRSFRAGRERDRADREQPA